MDLAKYARDTIKLELTRFQSRSLPLPGGEAVQERVARTLVVLEILGDFRMLADTVHFIIPLSESLTFVLLVRCVQMHIEVFFGPWASPLDFTRTCSGVRTNSPSLMGRTLKYLALSFNWVNFYLAQSVQLRFYETTKRC